MNDFVNESAAIQGSKTQNKRILTPERIRKHVILMGERSMRSKGHNVLNEMQKHLKV